MLRVFFHRFTVAVAILFALTAGNARAIANDSKEELVKAAFIYNFVKFVEWPGDKAIANHSNINICTMGSDGISHAGSVFEAASTTSLSLLLVPISDWKAATSNCHILFIGSSEEPKLAGILSGMKNAPVLTVGDSANFVERGGMIGFVVSDNKIKIAVNTKATAMAGLRVDAQLLEIALKVIK